MINSYIKDSKRRWRKMFYGKQGITTKDLEDFLEQELRSLAKGMCDKLLKEGHGGGNWRRLILEFKSNLQ